jgi:hypothetical protein
MRLILFVCAVLVGCGVTQPPTKTWIRHTPIGGAMEWRILVYTPLGVPKPTVSLDSKIATLEQWVLSRFGDCIEASFTAVPKDLGIGARDVLTLQTRPTNVGAWDDRWSGMATSPGNPESLELEQFQAVGLKQRLYDVELLDNYPDNVQEIGALVRTIMQATLASGQMGTEIIYDQNLVPITTFNIGAVKAKLRTVGDTFDAIASTVPGMVWGVNASRKFFFAVITGTLTIDDGVETTRIEPYRVAADQIVTAVRWVSQDGIAHKSVSSEAATYGQVVKPVAIDKAFLPYKNVPHNENTAGVDVSQTITSTVTGRVFGLYQRNTGGSMDIERTAATSYDRILVEVKKRRNSATGEVNAAFQMEQGTPATRLYPLSDNNSVDLAYYAKFTLGGGAAFNNVFLTLYCDQAHVWEVLAFDFQKLDTAKLDIMAQAHYRIPAIEPVSAKLVGLIAPAPTVTMIRRAKVGDSSSAILRSPVQPAAQFIYSITATDGAQTEIRVGQRDDADNLAYDRLVQAMADRALIGAVQIGTPP